MKSATALRCAGVQLVGGGQTAAIWRAISARRVAASGRHRTDRTRLSSLRGGAANPVATAQGGDGRQGGPLNGLPAHGGPLPTYHDLTGFDFARSEVNEALVRQLHRCESLENAHNVVLVGGPGTGKTHLTTALSVQAIEHYPKRVRFFSTIELVNALEQEKLQGKAGQIAARLCHSDLVILDELGYLPFSVSGGALLFHLLTPVALAA